MTRFSTFMPLCPRRPEQVLPFASQVQWGRADRLWQGQSMTVDPHQMFAFAAAAGFRIPVGIGVTLMPFRHPMEAAAQARSLAVTMGTSVVAGYGPGAAVLQASLRDGPYPRPLTAAREYLTIVRGLIRGEIVSHDGEYFSMHGRLSPLPGPPVELGLGVLRPRMARLAGEIADVAITWLTPAAYLVDQIIPALRDGATAVGRPTPRLVTVVQVAVHRPGRDPAELALAGNAAHLRLPHYRDMLRRAGLEVDAADLPAAARALVDSGVFISGEPDVIVKELDAYRAAGVDEIVLNLTGVCQCHGARAAVTELETIFEVLPGTQEVSCPTP